MPGPSARERKRHYEDFREPEKIEQGGEIRISGAFLLDHEEDILNLVKHQGKLAAQRDPDHKVDKIEKVDGKIIVTASDHNLALRIGKALSRAYKGRHEYKFRAGEKFVEVDWSRD